MTDKLNDMSGVLIQGHIKIHDPESNHTFVDKRNAIHYENMSIALAESLSNAGAGFIYEMSFGNGGTSVDPTGIITYLTPNSTGTNASLYNQTYSHALSRRAQLFRTQRAQCSFLMASNAKRIILSELKPIFLTRQLSLQLLNKALHRLNTASIGLYYGLYATL